MPMQRSLKTECSSRGELFVRYTIKDSPHPHCSFMLGFLNTNLWFNLSSTQSISLPIMLNSALLSMRTFTPSCSTSSSNALGFSTYSRWYAKPLHPRFRTPTLISFGSGWFSRFRIWFTAPGVRCIAAFLARNFGLGFARGCVEVCTVGFDF